MEFIIKKITFFRGSTAAYLPTFQEKIKDSMNNIERKTRCP